MGKSLFLLCPTDYLEPVINNIFKGKNYFYESLGNSFVTDYETMESLKELIYKHHIENIYFVLSSDNQIISDALEGQVYSDIKGLKSSYQVIDKEHSNAALQTKNQRFTSLSYYLNKKINKFQETLSDIPHHSMRVDGKIFNRKSNSFESIYSDLICIQKHCLN